MILSYNVPSKEWAVFLAATRASLSVATCCGLSDGSAGHRIIAALVGIFAVLLNWLPQWVASVWSLYSSEPLFQWLGAHHLFRFTFSPLYITWPITIILLGFILWGLFSPTRRRPETDSPFRLKSGPIDDQHPLAIAMDDLRALCNEMFTALLGPYYVADHPKPTMDDVNRLSVKMRACARKQAWGDLIRLSDLKRLEDNSLDGNMPEIKAKYASAGYLDNLTPTQILVFEDGLNRWERLKELIAKIEERDHSLETNNNELIQPIPNLGRMNITEDAQLTGLVLSVLYFGYDKGAKRLQAQMIFRNNAAPQRTIANVCFVYRAGGSSTTQLFNTQTNIGRYSVPINAIPVSNNAEHFLNCHADAEPSLFEKIDAQAGLLINFTDRNGSLQSRYIFILKVDQSATGYFYETETINGFSLDEQPNETIKNIDSKRMFFAIVAKIKAGVSPLRALQEVNAEELETNDMLIQLCNDLVKHGHPHPFASIRDTIPENKWLDFLIAAKCQGLDLSNELELFDLLQARSPSIRPLS